MQRRALFVAIAAGWIACWFWAFSFALDDSFFDYNRHSRIPAFLSALVCIFVIPLSALFMWRRFIEGRGSPVAALVIHLMVTFAALALPLAVTHLLAHAPQPWHLEADDAMGVGIYMAALALVAVLSVIVLAIALVIQRARRTGPASRGAHPR